jgi:hypothetical protein
VTTFRIGLLLFLFGVSVRLAPVILERRYEDIQQPEIVRIGRELATSGRFANPFPEPTGITAMCPPAYPYILSTVYRFFGFGARAQLAVQVLSSSAAATQYALLPWLALALGFSRRTGIWAGILGAGFPFWFWIETKGSYETTEASLLFLILLGVFAQAARPEARLPIWYGVLWGVLLLFNPGFLPSLLALSLVRIFDRRISGMREVATVGFFVTLVLLPWTVRNLLEFNTLFFVRNNFGLELHLSNQDKARPLFDQNIGGEGPYGSHPFHSAKERSRLVELGESRYFSEKTESAIAWIWEHPFLFVGLTVKRFFYYWFPVLNAIWKTVFLSVVTTAGLVGFFQLARRNRMAFAILGAAFLVYPLLYYLIQVDVRYRHAIFALLLLCGFNCFSQFSDRRSNIC